MAEAATIDEQLMARQLREEKKLTGQEGVDQSVEKKESLRQKKSRVRLKNEQLKQKSKKGAQEAVFTPARMGTNMALRWAWLSLVPSWGLSLAYINIHVLLRFVLGENLFCKLGREWMPRSLKSTAGEVGEAGVVGIGLGEVFVLIFLDLIVLLVALAFLVILTIIIKFVSSSLFEKAKIILEFGGGIIKPLFDLFI